MYDHLDKSTTQWSAPEQMSEVTDKLWLQDTHPNPAEKNQQVECSSADGLSDTLSGVQRPCDQATRLPLQEAVQEGRHAQGDQVKWRVQNQQCGLQPLPLPYKFCLSVI